MWSRTAAALLCAVALAGCGARPEERIVAHVQRGTEHFNVRRLDEAVAEFARAVELLHELPEGAERIRAGSFETTRAQVIGHLGTARVEKGEHARGVEDLTRALEEGGDNAIDRSERRMRLWTRSRAHEALGNLREA